MSKSQWEMARPNEAKLQEILENGCDWEQLAQSLLSWLSDDVVGEFARSYGYFDDDEEEEKQDEDAPDLVLEEDDCRKDEEGYLYIDKCVFDDFIKDSYIRIQFADDNEENVYEYKMINEDDKEIICEFIG